MRAKTGKTGLLNDYSKRKANTEVLINRSIKTSYSSQPGILTEKKQYAHRAKKAKYHPLILAFGWKSANFLLRVSSGEKGGQKDVNRFDPQIIHKKSGNTNLVKRYG